MTGHVVPVGFGSELVVAHRTAGADANLLGSEMNGWVFIIKRYIDIQEERYRSMPDIFQSNLIKFQP